MKVYFKHYTGAITAYDYLFFDCMAEVSLEEEDQALEEGWLPDDYVIKIDSEYGISKSHWYQARQTRIDLPKFCDNAKTRQLRNRCSEISTKIFNCKDVDMDSLRVIFSKYLNYKDFKYWDLDKVIISEPERKHFLIYYYLGKPVAFTFLRDVGTASVYSVQFAWDYEEPKLYLGKYANLAEIDYCIENNKTHMYIGLGYENACRYKADYKGFEFWNGELWSSNKKKYKELCKRDSDIKLLSDLEKCKDHDDQNVFKT